MPGRAVRVSAVLAGLLTALTLVRTPTTLGAAPGIPSPDQFIGFKVGADTKLARWDRIVEYLRTVAASSDRVRLRELGKTNNGNAFVMLEVSSADTLKNLDRYKQYEKKLYFQGGAPSARERDEIFRQGKVVVLVGASIHATEVGPTQATLDLVHYLATDDSPGTRKILDNVILLLVPSLNPDGQVLITDWYNRNLGTPYEASPLPVLYHPYVGHDNNRDMYMFTQKESQYVAQVAWHDWLPSVWLDQHQMGAGGPRIFVMPATDPINPNVHPLIYRWNAILGQSQAAALEAAGKDGIIYNSTYTNFWQGAMAWAGWWHNQVGLLTEIASVRIASPVEQTKAASRTNQPADIARDGAMDAIVPAPGMLGPPVDTTPRTEYPRPWLGGKWTLRDIVDYQHLSTLALLDTAADRREAILRQIYEVNRQTIEDGRTGSVKSILIPLDLQQDAREALHLAERLMMGGVEVFRADAAFEVDDRPYSAGTLVIPMTQVFARYARDLLEQQKYPEVRRAPNLPADPPYDMTAWSLGMQFGVTLDFSNDTLPSQVKLTRVVAPLRLPGRVSGTGARFMFEYTGADSALAVNRLLKEGVKVALTPSSHALVDGAPRALLDELARDLGMNFSAVDAPPPGVPDEPRQVLRMPRVALYAPWTGGNIDEGWTRWVLEQYEFPFVTVHNADLRAGGLRRKYDAIILADQAPREIVDGNLGTTIRPEYRGGIGDQGVDSLQRFVSDGGTLIALGAASDLVVDRFPVPVRNQKRALRRDQHFAPGTILRIQVDTSNPIGYGMSADTYGFYNNSPFFNLVDGFNSAKASVIARYPNEDIVASGWLRGEDTMAGRAAVVEVNLRPGRIVLFGLRPQHRAQTHATFPMLFNSLYLSAEGPLTSVDEQQQQQ